MRVLRLHRQDPSDYSCVSYWVLGENNAPGDRNTLIDTGSQDAGNLAYFLDTMGSQPKGIGKKAVERIILTHAHYDHTGGVGGLEAQFDPEVFAWLPAGRRHRPVVDGMTLRVGDEDAVLLHTPGHSEDSLCVHVPAARVLFSGDTLYRITDHLGAYPRTYLESLSRLAALDIQVIYPGHGQPILKDGSDFIRGCLENVGGSRIQD